MPVTTTPTGPAPGEAPYPRMTLLLGGFTTSNPVTREEFLQYCREDAGRLCDLVFNRFREMEDRLETMRESLRAKEEEMEEIQLERDVAVAERDRYLRKVANLVGDEDSAGPRREPGKSAKIPDPPELTDGKDPPFDHWYLLMQQKLAANADHFTTPQLRIAYVVSRTKDKAQRHVMSRMRPTAVNRYGDADDIFKHLDSIFGDPNRVTVAKEKFIRLAMKTTDKFHDFLSDFLHLADEAEIHEDDFKDELYRKLTKRLQIAMVKDVDMPVTFKEFSDSCAQVYSRYEIIGQPQQGRTFGGGTRTASAHFSSRVPPPAVKVERSGQITSMSAEIHEQLMRQGKCFGCQEFGHILRHCPKTRVPLQLKAMEADGDRKEESADIARMTGNERA